ncbi:hypothetical protein Bca52824_045006 [Brassica carinata]|uniref:Uncharacterized protein n=1 Tax=Brassica carinata TaxID=52824 RepID=A0A8X7RCY7_BRACI|nr:hypothetical protein Bca52824_045006 [Brassica carinata]
MDCSRRGGGGASSSAKMPSSSTEKSSVTATLRTKREEAAEMEREAEIVWRLKEREGGRRETEEGLEMVKGRDLGVKVERAREEAEAAMVKR